MKTSELNESWDWTGRKVSKLKNIIVGFKCVDIR